MPLDSFLVPSIWNAIVWTSPDHTRTSYPNWPYLKKWDLNKVFLQIQSGSFPGLSQTPSVKYPNNLSLPFYEEKIAWQYYIAYLAQSLVTEIKKLVPWSITNFSADQLAMLFDSELLFLPFGLVNDDTYIPIAGLVTPGDPIVESRFVMGNFLANSQLDTVTKLLEWCRTHLVHWGEGESGIPNEYYDIWQYHWYPPMERIISGTSRAHIPMDSPRHWTAGCNCTAGFLNCLLRTVNIPTRRISVAGPRGGFSYASHAAFQFAIDGGKYLCHCDDPYWTDQTIATPQFSTSELLVDETTFDNLFGPNVSEQQQEEKSLAYAISNVAIKFLSDGLLRAYCIDLDPKWAQKWWGGTLPNMKPHPNLATDTDAFITEDESPQVVGMLYYFTIDDLRQMNLWTQIRNKIHNTFNDQIDNIPAPLPPQL
jgi:hypothetical protein